MAVNPNHRLSQKLGEMKNDDKDRLATRMLHHNRFDGFLHADAPDLREGIRPKLNLNR